MYFSLKNVLRCSAPKARGKETSPPGQVGTPETVERRRPPTLPTLLTSLAQEESAGGLWVHAEGGSSRSTTSGTPPEIEGTGRINSSLNPNPVGGRAKPSERQTRLGGRKVCTLPASLAPEEGRHQTPSIRKPAARRLPETGGDLPGCCRRGELVGSTPRANLSLGTTGKTNFSAASHLPGELKTQAHRNS